MKTFKHKVEYSVDHSDIINVADKLGALGWILVAVTPSPVPAGPWSYRYDLYFLREITSDSERMSYIPGHVSGPNNVCDLH